jgi:hypothetical protein
MLKEWWKQAYKEFLYENISENKIFLTIFNFNETLDEYQLGNHSDYFKQRFGSKQRNTNSSNNFNAMRIL